MFWDLVRGIPVKPCESNERQACGGDPGCRKTGQALCSSRPPHCFAIHYRRSVSAESLPSVSAIGCSHNVDMYHLLYRCATMRPAQVCKRRDAQQLPPLPACARYSTVLYRAHVRCSREPPRTAGVTDNPPPRPRSAANSRLGLERVYGWEEPWSLVPGATGDRVGPVIAHVLARTSRPVSLSA